MKILWICFVWPEPNSSAAGVRTLELLQVLRAAGHEVRVSSPCQSNSYKQELERAGYSCEHLLPNDRAFDAYISDFQPEIVFFDRFMIEEQFGWRVKEQCPAALRILDTIDLHFLRRLRQHKVEQGESALSLSDFDLQTSDAIREISAIYRCDLSLIVSDFEEKLLIEKFKIPKELLCLCRFSSSKNIGWPAYEARSSFVTIGNFNHAPNLDSFKLLYDNLWPKISLALKQIGITKSELHIYGAYPRQDFLALDNKIPGFRVFGRAEDSCLTLSKYKVNLAPLRFGAGIKGKILDAWSCGTPCMATTVAAEGMCVEGCFGGLISDDWDDFIQKAINLYVDKQLWTQAQKQGLEIAESLFNPERNLNIFLEAINNSFLNRELFRQQNFVGQMLWHHQHRSTEFFSRWIEAKNK